MSVKTLFHTEYPMYGLAATTQGHVIVCGGGGVAKTGVPNCIEVFRVQDEPAETGVSVGCERQLPGAPMNMALSPDGMTVAVGVEGSTHLFKVQLPEAAESQAAAGAREAKILPNATAVTDLAKEAFQNVVRFNADSTLLATGGADGKARLWALPALRLRHALEVHKEDVEDVCFDAGAARLAATASVPRALVFDCSSGALLKTLTWQTSRVRDAGKYQFKHCRFFHRDHHEWLVCSMIPPRSLGARACYLVVRDAASLEVVQQAAAGPHALTALAVSPCGRYIGVGDNEGSVAVFTSLDLRRVLRRRTHELFVTGVDFAKLGAADVLLSVSVDRYCVHTPVAPQSGSVTTLLVVVVAVLALLVLVLLLGLQSSGWHTDF